MSHPRVPSPCQPHSHGTPPQGQPAPEGSDILAAPQGDRRDPASGQHPLGTPWWHRHVTPSPAPTGTPAPGDRLRPPTGDVGPSWHPHFPLRCSWGCAPGRPRGHGTPSPGFGDTAVPDAGTKTAHGGGHSSALPWSRPGPGSGGPPSTAPARGGGTHRAPVHIYSPARPRRGPWGQAGHSQGTQGGKGQRRASPGSCLPAAPLLPQPRVSSGGVSGRGGAGFWGPTASWGGRPGPQRGDTTGLDSSKGTPWGRTAAGGGRGAAQQLGGGRGAGRRTGIPWGRTMAEGRCGAGWASEVPWGDAVGLGGRGAMPRAQAQSE